MNASHSAAISVMYLSWINDELRREVELREQLARESRFMSRFKSCLVACASALALGAVKLFDF